MMIEYRAIKLEELNTDLFKHFIRHQVVTYCYRKSPEGWTNELDPFIDDWTPQEYEYLVKCLTNTLQTGGLVYGFFSDGQLKGFVSVESELIGEEQRYVDLSSIHVSEDYRGKGIGRQLFEIAKQWARENGADRLFISSHSAVETQAFYQAMGCVDARIFHPGHAQEEPYDRQLEYVL